MMLVLSRNQDEEVVIGNDIRLTVRAIRGNQVRLGFTPPPDVADQREELGEKAEGQKTLAVGPAASEGEPRLVTLLQPPFPRRGCLRWSTWRLRCSPG
jgi:carbon storage regulator CsrA